MRLKLTIILLLAALLGTSCSNRGAHMPKHRKQRHCNCPTFSMNTTENDAGSCCQV